MITYLRYAEYYGMQSTFDALYQKSKEGCSFNRLYELIISEKNIILAYRMIKGNKGSKTQGTDQFNIDDFKSYSQNEFINTIRTSLDHYKPKLVRRVFIPKPNGDKRPLGIPSMLDRLIQQMVKQILEPICEAKFYKHSYGFRPLRSTHHAKSRCDTLINNAQLHFVVDVDIKGFFDNVNHTLLLKQLWNIGIKDRRVLAIIGKMLKAPIEKEGIPCKGTPQGGILSPLLSNVVLNDLDHWVAGQWENFKTKHPYTQRNKYAALKKTKLKEGFIVRYADDFKIFSRTPQDAYKWYHAVKQYLKERLKLDISPEKSMVINLRKKSSNFLGFKIKAVPKGKKHVAHSFVSDKKKDQIKKRINKLITEIKLSPIPKTISNWNSFVLGLHNYFKFASHVSMDFQEIAFCKNRFMFNRLKSISKYGRPSRPPPTYSKFYKNNNKTWEVAGTLLFPLPDVSKSKPLNFSQELTPYCAEARVNIHANLKYNVQLELSKLVRSDVWDRTLEYSDNRLSRYSRVQGLCEITGLFLQSEEVHCHHYKPLSLGGTDNYNNLRIIHKDVHRLVHATETKTIEHYKSILQLTDPMVDKLNLYRKACKLEMI
ncbi:group II intron reverse transcriptase/maturase [Paenibacillus sp. 23TSA30-6]|nr:group II intron reverse transcriptase/maturase [Paenibacillus sp. 23TSA30-6]